jgi:hypothetical protein
LRRRARSRPVHLLGRPRPTVILQAARRISPEPCIVEATVSRKNLPLSLAELLQRLAEKRKKFGRLVIERRERGHGELSMDRDQYFVVLHKGEWKIKHNGRYSHPYETQADAIRSAIDAAHTAPREGGLSQVLVQGQDLLFRTEWTYGKDPYPPPG